MSSKSYSSSTILDINTIHHRVLQFHDTIQIALSTCIDNKFKLPRILKETAESIYFKSNSNSNKISQRKLQAFYRSKISTILKANIIIQ